MNVKLIKSKMIAAFSLIELMVVIAIIAVLTAVALPSYKQYIAQSEVAEIFSLASNQMQLYAQYYNAGSSFDYCTGYSGAAITTVCSSVNTITTAAVGNYIAYTEIYGNGSTSHANGTSYSNYPVIIQLTNNSSSGANNIDPSLNNVVIGFKPTIQANVSGDSSNTTMVWNTCVFSGSSNATTAANLLKSGNCTSGTVN